MARGMWTGVAQGMQDIQERRRYRQEREDKLSLIAQERADREAERAERRALLNQERQDKLFEFIVTNRDSFSTTSGLTPAKSDGSSSKGSQAASPEFYELQLKKFNFPEEVIADLSLKGPGALQTAIEVYKENYNPENPYDESDLRSIADSIFIENITDTPADPIELGKKYGLDLSLFPEGERQRREDLLTIAFKPKTRTVVASTYQGVAPIEPKDILELQTVVAGQLKALLEAGKVGGTEEQQVEYTTALRELDAGSPTRAINLLNDTGELAPAMQELFANLKNQQIPLGVFEPVRKALEVSTPTAGVASVPQQAVGYLRANKDTPGVIEAFEEKYGVSAEEYL